MTEQIDDDSQGEPALGSPDRTDISCPFPVGVLRKEITVQKVGYNSRLVAAVGRDLVATGMDKRVLMTAMAVSGSRV